jgi:hypothetical protein
VWVGGEDGWCVSVGWCVRREGLLREQASPARDGDAVGVGRYSLFSPNGFVVGQTPWMVCGLYESPHGAAHSHTPPPFCVGIVRCLFACIYIRYIGAVFYFGARTHTGG